MSTRTYFVFRLNLRLLARCCCCCFSHDKPTISTGFVVTPIVGYISQCQAKTATWLYKGRTVKCHGGLEVKARAVFTHAPTIVIGAGASRQIITLSYGRAVKFFPSYVSHRSVQGSSKFGPCLGPHLPF